MRVYRWKHTPTGLFYTPVKGLHGTKSNLSKDGKIYVTKYNPFRHNEELTVAVSGALIKKFNLNVSDRKGYHQQYTETKLSEWVEIEYELNEVVNE